MSCYYLYGFDLEVKPNKREHHALEILNQVIKTPQAIRISERQKKKNDYHNKESKWQLLLVSRNKYNILFLLTSWKVVNVSPLQVTPWNFSSCTLIGGGCTLIGGDVH